MTRCGRGTSIESLKRAAIPCLLFAASTAAFAQAAPNVTEPQGINLGVTSFFDGFSGPPGFSYLGVLRYTSGTSIKDKSNQKLVKKIAVRGIAVTRMCLSSAHSSIATTPSRGGRR